MRITSLINTFQERKRKRYVKKMVPQIDQYIKLCLEPCYEESKKEEWNEVDDTLVDIIGSIRFSLSYSELILPEKIINYLKTEEVEESFSEKLFSIIREKNLDYVEVYKKADLDRRHFAKIRNEPGYVPKKITIVLLCISMKLSYEETQELLKTAGLTLSRSMKMDIVTEYFLKNKIYDVLLYKEILYSLNLLNDFHELKINLDTFGKPYIQKP